MSMKRVLVVISVVFIGLSVGCILDDPEASDEQFEQVAEDGFDSSVEPTMFEDIGAESDTRSFDVGASSTGTWSGFSIESCNDFPCGFFPTCPSNPAGKTCSPRGSQCIQPLSGPWAKVYMCL